MIIRIALILVIISFAGCSYKSRIEQYPLDDEFSLMEAAFKIGFEDTAADKNGAIRLISYGTSRHGLWVIPPQEFMERMKSLYPDLEGVRPVQEKYSDNRLFDENSGRNVEIYYVDILKMKNESTAIVTIGFYGGLLYGGERDFVLIKVNGDWLVKSLLETRIF